MKKTLKREYGDSPLSNNTSHLPISFVRIVFKNELNTTSVKYINHTRIINACRLLLCSEKTIGEISEEVGFKDQYYFTRVFNLFLKMTPTQYRKNRIVT